VVLLDEDDINHHHKGRDGEDGKEKRADVVEGHKGSLEGVECSRNKKDHITVAFSIEEQSGLFNDERTGYKGVGLTFEDVIMVEYDGESLAFPEDSGHLIILCNDSLEVLSEEAVSEPSRDAVESIRKMVTVETRERSRVVDVATDCMRQDDVRVEHKDSSLDRHEEQYVDDRSERKREAESTRDSFCNGVDGRHKDSLKSC
jgi:hypothetical protein